MIPPHGNALKSQDHDDSTEPGRLYVVATPIGNLDDISHRAIDVLRRVGLILCEDTRRTRILLAHYDIRNRCESFHEHSERAKTPEAVARLVAGAEMAIVSDGGTPLISDPGYRLVTACRAAGIEVIPIPGPSAVTAILSVAGLPTDRFVFEGFLPPKGAKRARRIAELAVEARTIVLFESPHRIARALDELAEAWGNERRCCLGRELTKKFEEIRRGTLAELAEWSSGRTLKGEITLAVSGATTRKE
jgi:16S rRNA (cytidine1402-2'-O)-methyltransferase